MGVLIKTPLLNMEIKIVSITQLHIHEEIITPALEQLKQEILSEQVLKHPMIVDSSTFVVLDGMHRVAALRSLGCHLALVCLVDYQNPAIELFAWYREFEGNTPFLDLIHVITEHSTYNTSITEFSEAIRLVNSRTAFAALASQTDTHVLQSPSHLSITQTYSEIAHIEKLALQMGFNITYSTESDALECLQTSSRQILIVPPLTKQEVVEAALQGKLYTHKTTRHVVPARPLFVNVPLEWLYLMDSHAVDMKMKNSLDSKRIVRLEPGTIIDGRRYEEPAYVFRD